MPSTFVSVICLSFSISSQRGEKPKKKKRKEKRITPDLRLEGLRKEREFFFLFCLDRVGLDFSYDRGRLGQNEDSKWREAGEMELWR